jgi:hypothetical protein
MTKPFLLVQLSDPHIGATWADGDPVAGLRAAVEAVHRLPDDPDAVLMSGDLADNAADGEYELARELLAQLGAPAYVLPGNHDDRDTLRRHFDLPGAGGTPVQYVDLGPLRLVVLDSTRPGEDRGELDVDRLTWLDAELAVAPDRVTVLALQHPPVSTGIAAWDEIGLPVADRRALASMSRSRSQPISSPPKLSPMLRSTRKRHGSTSRSQRVQRPSSCRSEMTASAEPILRAGRASSDLSTASGPWADRSESAATPVKERTSLPSCRSSWTPWRNPSRRLSPLRPSQMLRRRFTLSTRKDASVS